MSSAPKSPPRPAAPVQPPARSGPAPATGNAWWRHPACPACLLILLVVVAYLPALRAGFIWDDDAYVTQNPLLTNPGGWREIWFSAHTQSQYFPLVYTTFRAEHALWGFHPLGFHLVNVVLHGCVAVLVWQVLRRLSVPGAWLAAAIFALHPVQVETVAWVTELKNIESLLFYLLAVLAWMKFDESPAPRCWRFYGLALAAYLLALFAKTTACTLPAALVLVLWLRGKRFAWSRALAILPFVLIGLAMGAVTIWWEGHLDNFNQDFDVSLNPLQRLLLAGRALWFYAGKLAWPMGLTFSYPHWDINPAELWQYVPLAGCLAVAALAWVWRKKIGRGPLAGLVFFVAALSPLLGFLMEYTFRYSFVADHYQYGASIGLIAVAAAILVSQLAKTGLLPAVQAALLLLLGCLTWHQAGAYQNLETLWGDTVSKNPGSWMAQHNLASELFAQGRQDEAFPHFQAAVALHPGGDVEQADLGLALMEKGLDAEALPHFEAALAVNPHLFAAQNNLALACADLGNLDQAVAHFKLALQLNTNSPGTLLNLGDVFQRQNRLDDAVQCYRQLTAQFPADVEPWRRLMAALLAAGRSGDALAAGQQGLAGTGHNVALLSDLGNAWFAQTNYDAAAGCFRGALKAAPASAELHFNLAVILGLQGHEAAEREELQTVLRLKPDFSAARQKLLSLPAPQGK